MANETPESASLMVLAVMIDHHLKVEKALKIAADKAGLAQEVADSLDKPGPLRRRELSVHLKRVTRSLDGKW